jgi:hypothetical protein
MCVQHTVRLFLKSNNSLDVYFLMKSSKKEIILTIFRDIDL